jgi:hypothetical protein
MKQPYCARKFWSKLQKKLDEKYEIVAYIDLFYWVSNGNNLNRMYTYFKQFAKDRYNYNEKIVLVHNDTDFYITKDIGILMYNLLECIRQLQISPSVFIILTPIYGINQELEYYYKTHYVNHDFDNDWFTIIENHYLTDQAQEDNFTNLPVSAESIKYPFSFLNGCLRNHRKVLLSLLNDADILDLGIVSWWFAESNLHKNEPLIKQVDPADHSEFQFITTVPHTRINDLLPLDDRTSQIVTSQYSNFANSNFAHHEISGKTNDNRWGLDFLQKSFVQVVAETVFNYPRVFFTEKTFRNFLLKRPFIIVGPTHTLDTLHNLGFKTFNDFWDESYDFDEDPLSRIHKIFNLIKDISSKSIDELQDMCNNMSDILEHNANHYINYYADQRINELFND